MMLLIVTICNEIVHWLCFICEFITDFMFLQFDIRVHCLYKPTYSSWEQVSFFFFFYTKFINSFFNTMKTFFIWHYGNPFKRLDILNGIGKKRWNAITFCWFQLIICQDWKSITKDLFWITFTTYHGICSILMTISLLME